MAEPMVLVGCKAPNGLVLNLHRSEKVGDQGAVRFVAGKTATLNGWARPFGEADVTQGGYMLTPVPQAFWDEWLARNGDSSLLEDKIILPPHRDINGAARDHAEVPQMHRPARVTDVPGVKADKAAA